MGAARLENLLVLLLQFAHGLGASPRGALVAGDVDLADVGQALDGVEGHDHHDRRAVGVGNDVARMALGILRIDLWDDERHVLVHAKQAAVVDHHGPVARDGVGEASRRAASGTGEGDIDATEVVVVLEQADGMGLAPEEVLAARATFGTKQKKVIDRELALFENAKKLLSYGAACANDSYFHFSVPFS